MRDKRHGFKYRLRYGSYTKPVAFLQDMKYLTKYKINPIDFIGVPLLIICIVLVALYAPFLNHSMPAMIMFCLSGFYLTLLILDKTVTIGNGFVKMHIFMKFMMKKLYSAGGVKLKKVLYKITIGDVIKASNGMYAIGFEIDGYYTSEVALGDIQNFEAYLTDFYNSLTDSSLITIDIMTRRQDITPILKRLEERTKNANDEYEYAIGMNYLNQAYIANSVKLVEERTVMIMQNKNKNDLYDDVQSLALLRGVVLNKVKKLPNEETLDNLETYTGSRNGRPVKYDSKA